MEDAKDTAAVGRSDQRVGGFVATFEGYGIGREVFRCQAQAESAVWQLPRN